MEKFICTDSNGNDWFEIDGVTYGIAPDGRGMDEDGIPLDSVDSELNTEIQERLAQAVEERKK